MPERAITGCEHETDHPEICLVAMAPVSSFIRLERDAEDRSAATWSQALTPALLVLKVVIVQVTSDEAKGLLRHVERALGAPHSPDLFHLQHEVRRPPPRPWHAPARRPGAPVTRFRPTTTSRGPRAAPAGVLDATRRARRTGRFTRARRAEDTSRGQWLSGGGRNHDQGPQPRVAEVTIDAYRGLDHNFDHLWRLPKVREVKSLICKSKCQQDRRQDWVLDGLMIKTLAPKACNTL